MLMRVTRGLAAAAVVLAATCALVATASFPWDVDPLPRGLHPSAGELRRDGGSEGELTYEFDDVDADGQRTLLRYRVRPADGLRVLRAGDLVERVECSANGAVLELHLTDAGRARADGELLRAGTILAGDRSLACGAVIDTGRDGDDDYSPRSGNPSAQVLHRVERVLSRSRDGAVVRVAAMPATLRDAFASFDVLLKADSVASLRERLLFPGRAAAPPSSGTSSYGKSWALVGWNYNSQTRSAAQSALSLWSSGGASFVCKDCWTLAGAGIEVRVSWTVGSGAFSGSVQGAVAYMGAVRFVGSATSGTSASFTVPVLSTDVAKNVQAFSVYGIPIYLDVNLRLDIGGRLVTASRATVSTGVNVLSGVTRGFNFNIKTGYSSTTPVTQKTLTPLPIAVSASGSATVVGSLKPTLTVTLAKLVSGGVRAEMYLRTTTAYTSPTACAQYTVAWGITSSSFALANVVLGPFQWQTGTREFLVPEDGPTTQASGCTTLLASVGAAEAAAILADAESVWARTEAVVDPKLASRYPGASATLSASVASVRELHASALAAIEARDTASAAQSGRAANAGAHTAADLVVFTVGADAATCSCAANLTQPLLVGQSASLSSCNGVPSAPMSCWNVPEPSQAVIVPLRIDTPGSYLLQVNTGLMFTPAVSVYRTDCCGAFVDCKAGSGDTGAVSLFFVSPGANATYVAVIASLDGAACGSVSVSLVPSTQMEYYVDSDPVWGNDTRNNGGYQYSFATLAHAFNVIAQQWDAQLHTVAYVYVWPNLNNTGVARFYYPPFTGEQLPAGLAGRNVVVSSLNSVPTRSLLSAWTSYSTGDLSQQQFTAATFGTGIDTQMGCPVGPTTVQYCRAFDVTAGMRLSLQGLWFQDFSVDNGAAIGTVGAAVRVSNATVSIANSFFWSGYAYGGAPDVYATQGANVTVTGSVCWQPESQLGAGSLQVDGGATLLVADVLFDTATAHRGDGGAVLVGTPTTGAGSLLMSMSTVQGSAAVRGGAVALSHPQSSATLSGVTVLQNTATLQGGAVFVSAGALTLQACRFVDNTAALLGGAVYVAGASASVVDLSGEYDRNGAPSLAVVQGGSLLLEGTTVTRGGASTQSARGQPAYWSDMPGNLLCDSSAASYSTATIANAQTADGYPLTNVACRSCTGSCTANCGTCPMCGVCDTLTGNCTTATFDSFCAATVGSGATCSPFNGSCWVQSRALDGFCTSTDGLVSAGVTGGVAAGSAVGGAIIALVIAILVMRASTARRVAAASHVAAQKAVASTTAAANPLFRGGRAGGAPASAVVSAPAPPSAAVPPVATATVATTASPQV